MKIGGGIITGGIDDVTASLILRGRSVKTGSHFQHGIAEVELQNLALNLDRS